MHSGIASLRGYENGGKIPRREFLKRTSGIFGLLKNLDVLDLFGDKDVLGSLNYSRPGRLMDPSLKQIQTWLIQANAVTSSGGLARDMSVEVGSDKIWDNSRYRRMAGAPTAKELRVMWEVSTGGNTNLYSGLKMEPLDPSTSLTQRRPEAQVPRRTREPSAWRRAGYPGAFDSPVPHGWPSLSTAGRRGIGALLGALGLGLGTAIDLAASPTQLGSGLNPRTTEKLDMERLYGSSGGDKELERRNMERYRARSDYVGPLELPSGMGTFMPPDPSSELRHSRLSRGVGSSVLEDARRRGYARGGAIMNNGIASFSANLQRRN